MAVLLAAAGGVFAGVALILSTCGRRRRTRPLRSPRSLMWICGQVRGGWYMVVGDQGAVGGRAELPVEPDRRVEGEQALDDAGPQPRGDPAAVTVQAKLVLQGPDDRLHPLPQPVGEAARVGLVLAGGAHQRQVLAGQG